MERIIVTVVIFNDQFDIEIPIDISSDNLYADIIEWLESIYPQINITNLSISIKRLNCEILSGKNLSEYGIQNGDYLVLTVIP